MGKAPAFQFYPGDWFREPGLKLVDINVRGAWAELLMVMWDENPRGIINTHVDGLSKLWRISHNETCFIVDELAKNRIADVEYFDKDCQKCIEETANVFQGISDDVPFCPQNVPKLSPYKSIFVSITSRRMLREWNIKEKERLKKQNQRKKPIKKGTCPDAVPQESTSYSSSSSSSTIDLSKDKSKNQPEIDFKKPTKKQKEMPSAAKADSFKNDSKKSHNHFSEKVGSFFESIKKSCEIISRLPQKNGREFNPYQWVQKHINEKRHPGAIDEVLKAMSVAKYWNGIRGDPYAYANSILKTKNQNWNEKESIAIHNKLKNMDVSILAELTNGLFKEL